MIGGLLINPVLWALAWSGSKVELDCSYKPWSNHERDYPASQTSPIAIKYIAGLVQYRLDTNLFCLVARNPHAS